MLAAYLNQKLIEKAFSWLSWRVGSVAYCISLPSNLMHLPILQYSASAHSMVEEGKRPRTSLFGFIMSLVKDMSQERKWSGLGVV